ncbi:hypothetical protein ES703_77037 [subsurface metagenome]
MDSWNALPKDLQEIIYNQVKDDFIPSTYVGMEDGLRALAGSGVRLVTLSDEEVAKVRELAFETWEAVAAKGPTAKEAVEIIKNYYK